MNNLMSSNSGHYYKDLEKKIIVTEMVMEIADRFPFQ